MGDLWYLALAYGVIWTGLLAYLLRLGLRTEGLRRDLTLLRQVLQGDQPAGEEAEGQAAGQRVQDDGLAAGGTDARAVGLERQV